MGVLNLIINGIPSIRLEYPIFDKLEIKVLNLIINGIPSIHKSYFSKTEVSPSFKPYYKWNTFNTLL